MCTLGQSVEQDKVPTLLENDWWLLWTVVRKGPAEGAMVKTEIELQGDRHCISERNEY